MMSSKHTKSVFIKVILYIKIYFAQTRLCIVIVVNRRCDVSNTISSEISMGQKLAWLENCTSNYKCHHHVYGVDEVNNSSVCITVVHGPSSSSAMAISHDPSLQPYSMAMLSNVSFDSIKNFRVGFSCGISTGVLLHRLEMQVPSCHP